MTMYYLESSMSDRSTFDHDARIFAAKIAGQDARVKNISVADIEEYYCSFLANCDVDDEEEAELRFKDEFVKEWNEWKGTNFKYTKKERV